MIDLWKDAPFGFGVYEVVLDDQGALVDMIMRWANRSVELLIEMELESHMGELMRLFAPERWAMLQGRFSELVVTGRPFSYLHTSPAGEDYVATAWYTKPFIGIKVRETSTERVQITESEIGTALRMLEQRTRKTQELAELLRQQAQKR